MEKPTNINQVYQNDDNAIELTENDINDVIGKGEYDEDGIIHTIYYFKKSSNSNIKYVHYVDNSNPKIVYSDGKTIEASNSNKDKLNKHIEQLGEINNKIPISVKYISNSDLSNIIKRNKEWFNNNENYKNLNKYKLNDQIEKLNEILKQYADENFDDLYQIKENGEVEIIIGYYDIRKALYEWLQNKLNTPKENIKLISKTNNENEFKVTFKDETFILCEVNRDSNKNAFEFSTVTNDNNNNNNNDNNNESLLKLKDEIITYRDNLIKNIMFSNLENKDKKIDEINKMFDPILDEIDNITNKNQSEFNIWNWLGEFEEWEHYNKKLYVDISDVLANDNICI